MNQGPVILLLGASGAVGGRVLERSAGRDVRVLAVSRRAPRRPWEHVTWLEHDLDRGPADVRTPTMVSLGPLFHALQQVEGSPGIGRVIALSSASTLFKRHSPDATERSQMRGLADIETQLIEACRVRDINLTLLKTTLIYGGEHDANLDRIAGLARRLPRIPVAGRGLRQPVHADDLARLIFDCLIAGPASEGDWLIGGGETLSYPDMIARVASAAGHRAKVARVPMWLMKSALAGAHLLGRLKDINAAMIERQAMDLVVDDTPAREQLGWNPRPFRP